MDENLIKRITTNSDISFGKPTVRGSRYSVEMILDLLATGMTFNELLNDYEGLEEEDIKACLLLASKLIKVKSVHKITVA